MGTVFPGNPEREKSMSTRDPRPLRRFFRLLLLALVVLLGVLLPAGCKRAAPEPGLRCNLLELRSNPVSHYYDAVIRLEGVAIKDALKDDFQVMTPTSAFNMSTLKFTVEGGNPARLEPGDVFVVPLKRPDWKLSIMEGDTEYCAQNFRDRLPPEDRWHPTKTEAMDVARSIEVLNENGAPKPVPALLPPEWRLVDETGPAANNPVGSSLYQKLRGGRTVEQVEVQYAQLTEEEKAQLAAGSPADFLSGWSECAKTGGAAADIAGNAAVACDLEGVGEFGWTYRYFYLSSGLVVAVDVQSDPEELGKSDLEKEQERRTNQVFLRYGYGPVGREEWQVMIDLRMDRTGTFHKRPRGGETVDKDFKLGDGEFATVEKALADNNFTQLRSRSAAGPGFESFIAIRDGDKDRTVQMTNVREPHFENIAGTIRRIVLPKVDENAMQPKTR
jgi:hypothetical protein